MFPVNSVRSQTILQDTVDDMSDGKVSKMKLSKAVSQRLIRICRMLLRVLERWDDLERFYVEKEKDQFPLKEKKDEVS